MNNPANKSNVDNGVTFVQFLWEQCKPELEILDQDNINAIWSIIFSKTTRPGAFPESGKAPNAVDNVHPLSNKGYQIARVEMLNGIEAVKRLRNDAPDNLKASFQTDIDKLIFALKVLDQEEAKTDKVIAKTTASQIHNDLEEKHNEDAANKKHLDSLKKKGKDQS